MTDITMPKLSDTMTEGKLVSWKKSKGERVERGEVIAEVETDKANMELEAFSSGVLLETRAKPGDTITVGTVIAVIGEPGEEAEEKSPPPKPAAEPPPSPAEAPAEKKPAEKAPGPVEETQSEAGMRRETGLEALGEGVTAAVRPEAKAPVPEEKGKPRPERTETESSRGVERASPMVRRLARERGIDLSTIGGSGPEGRVTREDVERYSPPPEKPAGPRREKPPEVAEGTHPISRMRGAIARKVSATWQSTPHFALTVEADMGITEQLYRGLRDAGYRVSINDFVIKASAVALRDFPLMRSSFFGEEISIHGGIDIGVAVALEEGLVIPVIRGCDRLSLTEIAGESRRLAEKAKAGKITEEEISGGVFTVSNLGMYGIDEFMAVINSPEAAILAVGKVADRAMVKGGALVPGRSMRLTISVDHRLVDGAYAAHFLDELRHNLENPAHIVIDDL